MIEKNLKIKILSILVFVVLLVLLAIFLFSGGNLELIISIFDKEHTAEQVQEKLTELGTRGHITMIILSMLQVAFPFLPAEPVQVLSGLTFGFITGFLCSLIGVIIGNSLIFLLYKLYGNGIKEYFVKNLNFDLEKAANSSKITGIIFLMYFLPAIPYGMICFFAASMGMKYPRYMLVTVLGSIPSICIGVGLGHMTLEASWILSVIVFSIILVMLIVVTIMRKKIFAMVNEWMTKPKYSSKTTVKKYKPRKLWLPYVISKIILFFKNVKVKYTNKLEKEMDKPSIVLCNHGSFLDFIYAGSIIRKECPNFVVARLYFYKKWLGNMLKSFGCFPKSMFVTDLESAKNCLRVLKDGGVLAMMPEARLSTAGKFEDIQKETFNFLKKANVNVYTIKIDGDYFASPKWGNGLRRNARVEAELDILFTAEQVKELSVEEIQKRVEERLYYNDFEWIEKHPEIEYKSKHLAKGLENILTTCPICKSKFTLNTDKHDILCEKCGKIATLDNRYSFTAGAPFANFQQWYDWQKAELKAKIDPDPSYSLSSKVEFYLPSKEGKGMIRRAGEGVCTLDRSGLTYVGERDGEEVELKFPISQIYRLLFGAGENFEIYVGKDIHYFAPEEKRSCVEWYMASAILVDEAKELALSKK